MSYLERAFQKSEADMAGGNSLGAAQPIPPMEAAINNLHNHADRVLMMMDRIVSRTSPITAETKPGENAALASIPESGHSAYVRGVDAATNKLRELENRMERMLRDIEV